MSKFSFSKIVDKSSNSDHLPSWRADFRQKSTLPDVKAVRTDFLVNYGLIGLAVASLSLLGVREFNYIELQHEIDACSEEIDSKRLQHEKNLKDSGIFSDYMRYVDSFVKFKSVPVECLKVVSEVGLIKVGNMAIKNILMENESKDLVKKKDSIKIIVVGVNKGVAQANFAQVESAFEKLKALPVWATLKKYQIKSQKALVAANTQEQVIEFTFEISLGEITK